MNFKKISVAILTGMLAVGVSSCSLTGKNTNSDSEIVEGQTEVDTYTITFYYNSSVYATRTVNKGSVLKDIPTLPEREGYTIYWSIDDYSNISSSTNVYAIEEENVYSLSFYLDGVLYDTLSLKYGEVIVYPEMENTSNRVFCGWDNNLETMPSSNLSIYGTTSEVSENSRVISFYLDNQLYLSRVVEVGEDLTDIPVLPTIKGYSVTWDVSDFTNITDNLTVNAIKMINTYNITYYLDGEVFQTIGYQYQENIVAPDVIVPDGSKFSGWVGLPEVMEDSDLEIYGVLTLDTNDYDISKLLSGQVVNITDDGDYSITGTNTNISFNITATGTVNISLNDVTCTNIASSFITNSSANLNITIEGTNLLSESSSIADALIMSDAQMSFDGDGKLIINSAISGIMSNKCDTTINSGTYQISAYNAIWAKGKNAGLNITGGTFILTGTNSCLKAKQSINISGGSYNLNSLADGINTDGSLTIDNGTFTIEALNDGIQADTSIDINNGIINITSGGGHTANSTNTTSSNFIFEVVDTSSFTLEAEYYGLYALVGSTYIEIDSTNYATYSSATLYDRSSSKGIKSDGIINIDNGTIIISSLDDGIKSDETINITGGNITIDSSCDGIQADLLLNIVSGEIDITTYASYYQSTSGSFELSSGKYTRVSSDSKTSSIKYEQYNSNKSLKSDELITISGGNIIINSDNDGIHSNDYIEITGGIININSLDDGVHADTSLTVGLEDGLNSVLTLNVLSSYEGLEAGSVYINSGIISVISSDDGINAGGGSDSTSTGDAFKPGGGMFRPMASSTSETYTLTINGGILTVNSQGDGLDSNGSIYVNGGTTIVYGPTDSGNGAIDYGDSSSDGLIYTGGTVVAIGVSGMAQQSTSGASVMFTTQTFSSNSSFEIRDSSGVSLFSGTTLKSGNNIVFMSENVKSGSSYSLYIDNTLMKTAIAK